MLSIIGWASLLHPLRSFILSANDPASCFTEKTDCTWFFNFWTLYPQSVTHPDPISSCLRSILYLVQDGFFHLSNHDFLPLTLELCVLGNPIAPVFPNALSPSSICRNMFRNPPINEIINISWPRTCVYLWPSAVLLLHIIMIRNSLGRAAFISSSSFFAFFLSEMLWHHYGKASMNCSQNAKLQWFFSSSQIAFYKTFF